MVRPRVVKWRVALLTVRFRHISILFGSFGLLNALKGTLYIHVVPGLFGLLNALKGTLFGFRATRILS